MGNNQQTVEAKTNELGLNAQKAAEQQREAINATATFVNDAVKNIHDLAERAYPNDKANSARYEAKIRRSLLNYLSVNEDKLWGYMAEQNCDITEIVKGVLQFFRYEKDQNEKIQKVEIRIPAEFLKSAKLPATSTLDHVYLESRNNQIGITKQMLMALMTELQKGNPEIPSYRPSATV